MKPRPWEAPYFSVPQSQRLGPCPRGCGEVVVLERWRDYVKLAGVLTSCVYEVVEEHECAVVPRPVKPRGGRTA